MTEYIKVYDNNKNLIGSSEGNTVTINKLEPNYWYDDFTISYSNKGLTKENIRVGSFKTKHRREIILDIARRYLTKESIKKVIDCIYENGGHHLQLYISDNERFGISSRYLSQVSREPNTEYLTEQEVLDIIKYANERDILITPNVDIPSHSGKWLSIVKELYPTKVIASDFNNSLVDYWYNEEAYESVKILIGEVMELFKQDIPYNQRFNIGADEVPASFSNQPAFIDFINNISEFITSKGYRTVIWNDSIYSNGLNRLNKDIEIYYWLKPENGLSANDLAKNNRDITNCNFYSTTFLPSPKFKDSDIEWQKKYIENKFNTDKFCEGHNPDENFIDVNYPLNVRGTAMVFWSEHSLELNDEQYLNQVLPLISSYLDTSKSN